MQPDACQAGSSHCVARQVCQATEKPRAGGDATSLVEVGPRVCLNPILIFSGAFGGGLLLLMQLHVRFRCNSVTTGKQCTHTCQVFGGDHLNLI